MRPIRKICTIDKLGRIVIPSAIRKELSLFTDDHLDITYENGAIVMRKIDETCIFCGADEDLIKHKDKCICKNCIEAISSK